MALQIKSSEFKATSRVVTGADGDVISRTKTRAELQKERRQRTVRAEGRTRYALRDRGRTIKSARQKQGRAIARGAYETWVNPPRPDTGRNLKQGITGIAVRAGLTADDAELWRKLQALDETKLAQMYARNDLIFEVAFSYNGMDRETDIDTARGPMSTIPGKKRDLTFLVDQYEKAFGPIL